MEKELKILELYKHYVVFDQNFQLKEISPTQEVFCFGREQANSINTDIGDLPFVASLTPVIEDFKQQFALALKGKSIHILDAHQYSSSFSMLLSRKFPVFSHTGKIIAAAFVADEIDCKDQLNFFDNILQDQSLLITEQVAKNLHQNLKNHPQRRRRLAGDKKFALSPKQKECLKWLYLGKTAFEISLITGRSKRTVEKNIDFLKKKFECQTLFQLGRETAIYFL